MVNVVTGVNSRYKGSWEPPTEYVRKLLRVAFDPLGNNPQYTVMLEPNRLPVLKKKREVTPALTEADADYTIDAGAPGVRISGLHRELLNSPNVYYGEGEYQGLTWRGIHLLDDGPPRGVYFQPISFDDSVHGFMEDANGNIVSTGTPQVTARMRVESHLDFGSGFTPSLAAVTADHMRARDQDPGYVATITLNGVSPAECHAYEMEPDKRIWVRHLFGTGMMFYIAKVDCRVSGSTVTLTVDTKMRDRDLVEAIQNRLDVAAKNPVASLLVGRESGINLDSKVPWDYARSGWLPDDDTWGHRHVDNLARFQAYGATWLIQPVLTAEEVDILRFEVHFDENVAFHVSIYDQDPTGTLPADPFATSINTWEPPPAGLQVGFGQYNNAVGYYPHTQTGVDGAPTGAAITGDFVDDGGFQLDHSAAESIDIYHSPVHWVAIYVLALGGSGPYHGWARLTPGKAT
jgi:hypothetical protein